MDLFKVVTSCLLGFFSALFLEYLLKFRPGLAEKFVLKIDCQKASDKLYSENREAHKEIFRKLDEINEKQGLILMELGKKVDRQ